MSLKYLLSGDVNNRIDYLLDNKVKTRNLDHAITLYHFAGVDIKVDVEARFENDTLIIDGYDIGKRVEEYWGDSDYEYTLRIPPESVFQLYIILVIEQDDQKCLLKELARRFNTNTCFSEIRKLLDDHHIACEGFSWI